MSEVLLKPKLHNTIFRCAICGQWFDLTKKMAYMVMKLDGMHQVQENTFVPVSKGVTIDADCFADLKLSEDEPKVIVPKSRFGLGSA